MKYKENPKYNKHFIFKNLTLGKGHQVFITQEINALGLERQ
jgi:hypothetical protein